MQNEQTSFRKWFLAEGLYREHKCLQEDGYVYEKEAWCMTAEDVRRARLYCELNAAQSRALLEEWERKAQRLAQVEADKECVRCGSRPRNAELDSLFCLPCADDIQEEWESGCYEYHPEDSNEPAVPCPPPPF